MNRNIHDITDKELEEFIFFSKHCAACTDEFPYWSRPTISNRENDDCEWTANKEKTVFFNLHQESGKKKVNWRCQIHLGNDPVFYHEKFGSLYFSLKHINWFLAKGFKINLYEQETD
jgi:hypothetical protein